MFEDNNQKTGFLFVGFARRIALTEILKVAKLVDRGYLDI